MNEVILLYYLKFYIFFLLFSFLFSVEVCAQKVNKVVINEYIQDDVWQTKVLSTIHRSPNQAINLVLHVPKIINNVVNKKVQKAIYKNLYNVKDFIITNYPEAKIKLVGIVDADIKQYFIEIIVNPL